MSKPITKSNHSFNETMVIGAGHSILVGNVPAPVQEKEPLTKLSENFFSWNKTSKDSIQKFGFFGSDIDYNTYYPDLKPEDLTPKDNEFIEPMFRLLSETIVSKNWNPVDFSRNGVLKAAMPLILGQTVNCDHSTDIGNAIGSVSKVVWQDSYKVDGYTIPAGINGILKIDGKANPRIARGILMDPPSIHSNSVTVQFTWDKSHPELDDAEFWDKLGTYDKEGNMICKVCTGIVRFLETSLVSHGADTFAQKIGSDGKIVNPTFAKQTYEAFKEHEEKGTREFFFLDNKTDLEYYNNTQQVNNNKVENTNLSNTKMDKELKEFLEKLFGKDMLTLSEGKEASPEEAISLIQQIVSDKASLTDTVNNLTEEKAKLEEKISNLEAEKTSLTEQANLGKTYVSKLREEACNNYRKLMGDSFKENDAIYVMLQAENTPVVTLEGLNKTYAQKLEEVYPMHCNHCGSKDVSRASSVDDPEKKEVTSNKENPVDTAKAAANIFSRKNQYKVSE